MSKEEAARDVVARHTELDPDIREIYRFISANEEAPNEPLKLLEVTDSTFETGEVSAFHFAPSPDVPCRSAFATVTPYEFERIRRAEIALPDGWNLENAQRLFYCFKDKETTAKEAVEWHLAVDPDITEIYRFIAANEDAPEEPLKLLDVSASTSETGQVDFFGFSSGPGIPYRSVLATITPNELEQIREGKIALPGEWNLQTALRLYP